MRAIVALLMVASLGSGCISFSYHSTSSSYKAARSGGDGGPYDLEVVVDSTATRGDFEIQVTLEANREFVAEQSRSGRAFVDYVLMNQSMPAGSATLRYESLYAYESGSGGSQTHVKREFNGSVTELPTDCGAGARVVFHVSNSATTRTSTCLGSHSST